jgi:hypothetical protein
VFQERNGLRLISPGGADMPVQVVDHFEQVQKIASSRIWKVQIHIDKKQANDYVFHSQTHSGAGAFPDIGSVF